MIAFRTSAVEHTEALTTLRMSVRRATRALVALAGVLGALGAAVTYAHFVLGRDHLLGLSEKLDLDREMNVPTWFSSALLLAAGALLRYIAAMARREHDRYARRWSVLAWAFVLMSVDETAGLHGMLSGPVRSALHLSGALYYAWVVPVGLAVIAFALAYSGFVWNLPEPTRRLVAASGAIYVAGALGGELLEGAYMSRIGKDFTFGLLTVTEETLEMAGVVLFIYALLRYIAARWGAVRISLGA